MFRSKLFSTFVGGSARWPAMGLAFLACLPVAAQPSGDGADPGVSTVLSPRSSLLEAFARGEDVSNRLDALSKKSAEPGEFDEPAGKARRVGKDRRESRAIDALGQAVKSVRAASADAGGTRFERAIQELRAADLLVRGRFDQLERVLSAEGSSVGLERLRAARQAYEHRLDPVIDALSKPQPSKADRDLVAQGLDDLMSWSSTGTLRAGLLPYRSAELGARALPTGASVVPVYLDASDPSSGPEDLRSTATAPLSEAVMAKAAELGHDYVAIYEFVRNDIALETYAGSIQGAEGTLRSGFGNDVDQASLLVALLRASGGAARFVHGVIEVPIERLAADLGVVTDRVPTALARSGVAHEPVIRGGRLAAMRLEHVWVAAHLPYTNYRGSVVDFSGRTWLPLDPSWTAFETQRSTVLEAMSFDASAFRQDYLSTQQSELPLEMLRSRVESHLFHQGEVDPDWRDALGFRRQVPQRLGILPSTLPYEVVEVLGEWAELPSTGGSEIVGVAPATARWIVRAGEAEGSPALLDATLPLRDVVSRRVTLSYVPATVDDHRLSASLGGLGSVPAYLIRVRPVLKVDGRAVATGEPMEMGVPHRLDLDLIGAWGTERTGRSLISGSYTAIALGGPRTAPYLDAGDDAADTESLSARLLAQLALRYGAAWDAGEDELARWLGMSLRRPVPSVVFVSNRVRVRFLAGLPADLDWQGVEMDAALRVAEPMWLASSAPASTSDWRRLSALQGSALEHSLFEDILGVESISADKGLGLARDQGIAVATLQPGDDLSILDLPASVVSEVSASLAAGATVEVPVAEVELNEWRGSVWHVRDPSTGGQGYFLSGDLVDIPAAGGVTTINPSDWDPDVSEPLEDPYAEQPNLDPLATELIEPLWELDGQFGTVGQLFDEPIGVLVLDGAGRPVKGATVTFELESGDGELRSGTRADTILAVQSDGLGRAVVRLESGTRTADQPAFLRRDAEDTYSFQVLQNQIRASVESRSGDLDLSRPLVAYGFPDEVVSYERTNRDPRYSGNEYFESTLGLWSDTMQLKAVDAFDNPVANAEYTVFADGYWEGYVDIPVQGGGRTESCWVPDEDDIQLATFFDATVGSAGLPGDCPSWTPSTGDCGKTLKTVKSRSDGTAAVGVIPGNSWVQYEVGTRRSHEADAACEERLDSGDAQANFEQVCADLYAGPPSQDPKLSTEDFYYSFLVTISSAYDPEVTPGNPCFVFGYLLHTWENRETFSAVGVGSTPSSPLILAHYTLQDASCRAIGTPYCDEEQSELNVGGVDYPNCSCSSPPDGEWCDPCKRMWDLCSYGDRTMPMPGCLFGIFQVFDGDRLVPISDVETSCSEGCSDNDPDTECNCSLDYPSSIIGQRCNFQRSYVCRDNAWVWRPSFIDPEDSSTRAEVIEPEGSAPTGVQVSPPVGADPRIHYSVTGGSAPRSLVLHTSAQVYPWWQYPDYKGELRQGDTRYQRELTFDSELALEMTVIRPVITDIRPESIELDEEGRTKEPIEVEYSIEPGSYVPLRVAVNLSEGVANPVYWALGEPTSSQLPGVTSGTTKSASTGIAVFPRGLKLDPSWQHELQLVVNPGTRWEVAPEADDIDVARRPINLDGNVIRRADTSVSVSQTIDLAQRRSCATSDIFSFQLVRDAEVSLNARRIDGLNTSGDKEFGDAVEIFKQSFQAEGPGPVADGPPVTLIHESTITVEDLPQGDYELILRAEAEDGTVETRRARAFSRVASSDSLPLGHTLIEGVDLWNGALSLSRKDFEVPGRGPSLEFRRTYSSTNGADHGPLGIGWGHNYSSSAHLSNCGILTISGGEGSGMQFDMGGAPTSGLVELEALNGYHGSLIVDADEGSLDYYTLSGNRYHYVPGVEQATWALDSITDPNGNTVKLTYGVASDGLQLQEVTDATDRSLKFEYTVASFVAWQGTVITSVTGPGGLRMDFEYDSYGHLVTASREEGARAERYDYSPQPDWNYTVRHVLDRVEDLVTGAQTSYTYQVAPIGGHQGTKQSLMVTELRTPEAQASGHPPMLFDYDEAELLARGGSATTVVTDRRGQPTTYTFNDYGAVTSITDPLDHTSFVSWDLDEVLMKDRTDANQVLTGFTYDQHGNVRTETTGPWTVAYTYYPESQFDPPYLKNRVRTKTDRNGHVTTYTYDAKGNLKSESTELGTADDRPGGVVTVSHTYNGFGDRLTTTDGRGHTTHFLYDEHGFVEESRNALGHTTNNLTDERGRLIGQRNPRGRYTVIDYDTLDRVFVRRSYKSGWPQGGSAVGELISWEKFEYDDANRRRTTTDFEGRQTITDFDLEGRVVQITDAEQGKKVFEYDGEGNKLLESLWFGNGSPRHDVIFIYDEAGRLDQRIEPLGRVTDYEHDAVGNPTLETLFDSNDPSFKPRVKAWPDYDDLNRPRREEKTLFNPVTNETEILITHFEFDGEGRKISETDPLNRETAWTYDGLGRQIKLSEGGGLRVTRQFYDGAGNLEKTILVNSEAVGELTPSGDQVRTFTYDAANRMVSQTDAEGETSFSDFDDVGNVIRTTDARGSVIEYDYDALNRRTQTRERLQRGRDEVVWAITELTYDRVGNVVQEDHPNGNVIQHTYDGLNRRLSSSDLLGAIGSWTYDARGNVKTETDGEGHVTVNAYDALDRQYQQQLPEDREIVRTFDVAGNITEEKDPLGRTASFEFDTLNRRVRTTDPAPFAYTTITTYDAVGNVLAEQDRRGHTVDFLYDDLNRLTRRTEPEVDGIRLTQIYTYDAADNRLSMIDGRGISTVYGYDKENRRVETRRADLTIETTEYDAIGNPRFVTDANGHTTGFVYDERGLVLEENRPEASVTRHLYDLQGNRTHTFDANQKETRFGWDQRGRQETLSLEVEASRFATTRFTYDRNGDRLTLERPESGVQTFAYDAARRLHKVTVTQGGADGGAQNATTTYTYDKNSNLRFVDDAEGRSTEFVYDELNRRTRRIYPQTANQSEPSQEIWTYDANGNIDTFTDAKGQLFDSTWDALNRERIRTYPAQEPGLLADHLLQTENTYDGNHNLVQVDETFSQSAVQTTVHTYDDFDRLETVTDRWARRIAYGYDANGNRTSLQAPGQSSTYTYDDLNRLETVTTAGGLTTYGYHANSRLKSVDYPNGTKIDYTFDLANRLKSIRHHQGELLISSYDYVYDDNGNRLEQTEFQYGRGSELTTYGYDLADRLTSAVYPDEAVTYGYDKAGNRLTESVIPTAGDPYVKTFAYDARDQIEAIFHSLDPAENVAYIYDANGNQLSKTKNGNVTAFTVTSRNQIARIEENGTPVGTYGYDFRGLRISKYTDRETQYLYDDQSVLQRHDAGEGTITYEYGPDRLLSVHHPTEGRSFYLHDALGSVVGQTTEGGSLLGQYSYDAWGNRRHEVGNQSNVFGFTGHETDAESGLVYAKARFYDPEIGRFLSHDPVEGDPNNPPSLHRYLYAYQNPTVWIDPTGRSGEKQTDLFEPRPRLFEHGEKIPEGWIVTDTSEAGKIAQPPKSAAESGVADPNAALEEKERSIWQVITDWAQEGFDSLETAKNKWRDLGKKHEEVTKDRRSTESLDSTGGTLAKAETAKLAEVGEATLEAVQTTAETSILVSDKVGTASGYGALFLLGKEKAKRYLKKKALGKVPRGTAGDAAHNVNSQSALRSKLSGLQKAQQNAARVRELPDGRVRYYTKEVAASKEGPTRGASFVTEYNPQTGQTRQWMESYDHAGEVVRTHPKTIDGQVLDAPHFPPTKSELQ